PGFGPALAPEVAERLTRVQRQSLEGMAIARGMVLAGLVLTTGMTLVGAARLLFPAGLPREPIRRLLAGTALLSGVLRVIDGAQIAVVVRKGSLVLAESLNASHFPGLSAENLELVRKASPALAMGTAILFTAMVAGVFVLYGQYLGSERVRKLFAEEPSTEHTGT
ncbi:MAG TPA: hypothetical protein VK447_01720, partial [Myxococcaceae bacterium]|nr:hypothetical protein [Myxococcaceae bacterium]